VNLRGELVGINSAILSGSGGNIGIGFAIPVNMAKGVMDQLIKYGQVKRGVLGVNIYDVTPDVAKEFGLNEASGALVAGVSQGSAAEHAGIKTGDIIVSINGTPIHNASELRNTIGMQRVGDQVEIGLLRDGKPLKVTALVAEHSDSEAVSAADVHRGLEGADLADAPEAAGVLVRSVQDGSPAAQAGLRANDLIVAVGRTPVGTLKAFRDVAKGASFLMLNVKRGNAVVLIPIR
jgi:S1-C subfamily serine protease